MFKNVNRQFLGFYAAFVAGLLMQANDAQANNFGDIARNINNSIEELPGLATGISYMLGILLGVVGVLKLKDHVENPSNTPLKDGAVRLAAGGALFALPIVFESMQNTIGTTGVMVSSPKVSKAEFNVF
jgi:hypothetical protein